MCHGNSENSYGCSDILWICFIYGTNVSVSRSWILCKLLTANKVPFDQFTNKRVQIKILSILKLVSFASLAGNDFSEQGTQAKAHCERNLNRQLWSIRRKISHRCSRNCQCRHYYKSCWLFAFAFCKKYARKIGVLARWLFAFFKDLCTENWGKLLRKILRQQKNTNFSILNSSPPIQNNKTSRTSCGRLFENFLPSTPKEITFEISLNLARS